MGHSRDEARRAKDKAVRMLNGSAGVTGIGLARLDGGWGVKVNLSAAPPRDFLPPSIDGVPVRVEVTGSISKR